jgi:hypothetical protein
MKGVEAPAPRMMTVFFNLLPDATYRSFQKLRTPNNRVDQRRCISRHHPDD